MTHSNTNPRSGQYLTHAHSLVMASSTFSAHVALELPCSSKPTAPTRVVWSCRLNWCSVPASVVKGRRHRALSPTSARRPCHADEAITSPKQLSMVSTARVIWLCACVRHWPDRGLVFECVTCFYCRFNFGTQLNTTDTKRPAKNTLNFSLKRWFLKNKLSGPHFLLSNCNNIIKVGSGPPLNFLKI